MKFRGFITTSLNIMRQLRYFSILAIIIVLGIFYISSMKNQPIIKSQSANAATEKVVGGTIGSRSIESVTEIDTKETAIDKVSTPLSLQMGQDGKISDLGMNLSKKKEKSSISKIGLPHYTIMRNELISGTFRQGRIYVIVDGFSSPEELIEICRTMKKKNSNFTNLVICLYADTEIGRKLARGIIRGYESRTTSSAWLALYSYNPVEGEYFDSDPSGYIRGFTHE